MRKLVFILGVLTVVNLLLWAQQYTNMQRMAITNSLLDSTPIGTKAASTAAFTTASASGGFNGSLNGNASSASSVAWSGVNGKPPVTTWNWNWNGQGGQPSWLWGSNDGQNMFVWNPSNFSVNYSNSTGYVAWGNVANPPYPITGGQQWNNQQTGGQAWLWGTPDGNNMYLYNPGNFSVNYANSSGFIINNTNSTDNGGPTGRMKFWTTTATCSTPALSFNTCTDTWQIPGNWYGGGWYVVCSPGSVAQGKPALTTVGPLNNRQFLTQVTSFTANAAQFNFLTCMSWGN